MTQSSRMLSITFFAVALSLLPSHTAAQSIKSPRTPGMSNLRHRGFAHSEQAFISQNADPRGAVFTFVTIDVPNATFTIPTGIGPGGDVVGIYGDASFNEHGFLLSHGNVTTIDVPGSLVGASGILQTEANGINPAGDIVGDYFAPPGAPGAPECQVAFPSTCRRGFLFTNGQFSDVLVPGKKGSIPNSITPDGTIYGCDHNDDYFGSMVGFGRTAFGTFITLDAGGGELQDPAQSVTASMNNGATPNGKIIVGLYANPPLPGGTYHGYIVENGKFAPYDVPGSVLTQIWGINASADFVGLYDDTNNNEHGFLQRWGESAPITIDVPSNPPFSSILTDAFGINSAGHVVGLYIDSGGNFHGFLAVPTGGQ
jgi:hypothetical protein